MDRGALNLCFACRDVTAGAASGLVRAVCDLAAGLAELGHEVTLLTDATAPAQVPGVDIRTVSAGRGPGPFADPRPETAAQNLLHAAAVYAAVRRIHERERPVDAVLAPLWRSEGAICLLDDRFPTVISCMTSLQTMVEINGPEPFGPDLSHGLALERAALRRSSYLHGLTAAVLAKTVEDYGLQPVASTVIGRGLRDRAPGPGPGPGPGARAAASNGAVRILFVGRLERRKGVDTLLAAAGRLTEQGTSFRLTLAGPDVEPAIRETFERDARGDPARLAAVEFAGAVSDRELDRLYAESDIFCVPSRYESHGVALVEAMMFGKPIVTCDSGGIGEVVEAEHTALMATPDDADALALELARLAGDADLRARLGTAARERFEQRFMASEVAAQMQDFILSAIAVQRERRSEVSVGVALRRLIAEAMSLEGEDARRPADALLEPELEQARAELSRLHEAVAAQEQTLEFLSRRDDTLSRIEQGGWWRLRDRILPLLRFATWVRRRSRRRSAPFARRD
jgi:glycogen(starch) synthase